MDGQVLLAAAATLISVLATAAGFRAMLARRQEVVERLERSSALEHGMSDLVHHAPGDRAHTGGMGLSRLMRRFSSLARPGNTEELARMRQALVRAGYRGEHALEVFLGVKLTLAPVLATAFLLVNSSIPQGLELPLDAAVAAMLACLAYFLPNLWLRGKINERQAALERALPDAMDLLVTCVEAGLALDAAISRVGDEISVAAPVLGEELTHTSREIQAGSPRPEAFRRLAERTGVEDLQSLSAMLIQTDMFGTSIARALRVHSDGMRTRRMQRAEEKAAMVAVKMTIPLILCILPALVAVVMGPAVAMIVQNFSAQ